MFKPSRLRLASGNLAHNRKTRCDAILPPTSGANHVEEDRQMKTEWEKDKCLRWSGKEYHPDWLKGRRSSTVAVLACIEPCATGLQGVANALPRWKGASPLPIYRSPEQAPEGERAW